MCLSYINKLIKDERGVGAVEAALTLPILIVMMLGLMEVGRALFIKGVMTHSVQEGARFALVSPIASEEAIKDRVRQNFVLIDPANITAFTVQNVVNTDNTRTITITLSYNHQLIIPLALSSGLTFTDQEIVYTS